MACSATLCGFLCPAPILMGLIGPMGSISPIRIGAPKDYEERRRESSAPKRQVLTVNNLIGIVAPAIGRRSHVSIWARVSRQRITGGARAGSRTAVRVETRREAKKTGRAPGHYLQP